MSNHNHVHVIPVNDLIEHDEEGTDCVCMPEVVPVERNEGSFGYVITHHSLDGRERFEEVS